MEEMQVIADTREQQPWLFEGCIWKKLDTGDYTIQGYEDMLCIERKQNINEFSTNVTQDRFRRELVRMTSFKHAFIICEFDINDVLSFPYGSGIPQKQWPKLRVNSNFILSKINEFRVRYGVHVILAGSAGQKTALSIMKQVRQNERTSFN